MADTLLGGIIINEILVDPNGANNYDTDGNGTANATDEYVELYNSSGAAIDISGLQLWDQGVGHWFTFPPGTILQAGGHAMVMSGVQAGGALPTGGANDLFFDAGRGSALINNGGDNVVLYDPAGDEYISATFNGDALDDPTATYSGFSATATQSGTGENFGNDIDGFSLQRGPDGSGTFVNNETPTPGTTNICFTAGTLLDTPTGPCSIERLRPGDLLMTKDNGAQEIQWIWACRQPMQAIRAYPALNAIEIAKGALGGGLPHKTLRVSRHHRMLVTSKIARRIYGAPEVLAAAKDLTAIDGISPAPLHGAITYYHILMQRHEILFADGAMTESLYLGCETLHAIEPAAQNELRQIFGAMWDVIMVTPPIPSRPMVQGKKLRHLIARHIKNNTPLSNSALH